MSQSQCWIRDQCIPRLFRCCWRQVRGTNNDCKFLIINKYETFYLFVHLCFFNKEISGHRYDLEEYALLFSTRCQCLSPLTCWSTDENWYHGQTITYPPNCHIFNIHPDYYIQQILSFLNHPFMIEKYSIWHLHHSFSTPPNCHYAFWSVMCLLDAP